VTQPTAPKNLLPLPHIQMKMGTGKAAKTLGGGGVNSRGQLES